MQNSTQEIANASAVIQRIKEFNNLTSQGKLSKDNNTLEYAHKLIEKYKEYGTSQEVKKHFADKKIPVRNILISFSQSLYDLFPTQYESEFNPIFSKAGIQPNTVIADPETEDDGPSTVYDETDDSVTEADPETEDDGPSTVYDETDDSVTEAEPEPETEDEPETEPETEDSGYATDYTGPSIIDFLDQSKKQSDFESRRKLAKEKGIQNYTGTAEQNTKLLNMLRGKEGSAETPTEKPSTEKTPTETPKIKFNGAMVDAYVDMGGGKYIPATQDQLGNPNTQLYVKNPNKGQGEYLKPNYVKVRREGNEVRRQSQFGGALGSLSNLFGDIGNTLKKY